MATAIRGGRFVPTVGLRVLHTSGNAGTIRTVHHGRACCGCYYYARGGEGFIEFDDGEGGVFASFARDVLMVLTDGDQHVEASFLDELHRQGSLPLVDDVRQGALSLLEQRADAERLL